MGDELRKVNIHEIGLTNRDSELLLKIGSDIASKFLTDHSSGFPDIILFPENSALPLIDFFIPILEKAASQLGYKMPEVMFINPKSDGLVRHAIDIDLNFESNKQNKPVIVIIDDYASIGSKTVNRIQMAFNRQIPAYVFFGETTQYANGIVIGADVSWNENYRGGFDYRKQGYGKIMKDTGVNPVESQMVAIGNMVANKLMPEV